MKMAGEIKDVNVGIANADMLDGYMDGRDPNSPEPSTNRSESYRHGFQNGRDDLRGEPRAPAKVLRGAAKAARDRDDARVA